jgi:hypothetical protein
MAEVPVEYPDPRAVVECRFYLNNILFRKPGEFRLQLFSNKEFLLERRIMLRQL